MKSSKVENLAIVSDWRVRLLIALPIQWANYMGLVCLWFVGDVSRQGGRREAISIFFQDHFRSIPAAIAISALVYVAFCPRRRWVWHALILWPTFVLWPAFAIALASR
jgi:hypothetical protein